MSNTSPLDTDEIENIEQSERTDLPFLIDRIKALFIDTLILVVLMMIFSQVFGTIEYTGTKARFYALFVILIYDPLFVTLGGTLGHRIMKMRVRQINNESKNVMIHMALLRYIVKGVLGWISLLTITQNKNKRAIHDLISGSIVIKI